MTNALQTKSGTHKDYRQMLKKYNLVSQNINLYVSNYITTEEFNTKFISIINNDTKCEYFDFEDATFHDIIETIKLTNLYTCTLTCDNTYNARLLASLSTHLQGNYQNSFNSKLFYFLLALDKNERSLLNFDTKPCNIKNILNK